MLQELRVAEQRLRAVWEVLDGASVTEVARRFTVSRQSVHVWLRRYAADQGLGDRSSRPHGCPHQMSPATEAQIVEIRRAHPGWVRTGSVTSWPGRGLCRCRAGAVTHPGAALLLGRLAHRGPRGPAPSVGPQAAYGDAEPCSMTFGQVEFRNPPDFVRRLAERIQELNIKPELEVYDTGHVDAALALAADGLLSAPLQFGIVMGVAEVWWPLTRTCSRSSAVYPKTPYGKRSRSDATTSISLRSR